MFKYTQDHLVTVSPWPISIAFSLFSLATSLVALMHNYNYATYFLYFSLTIVFLIFGLWIKDIIREFLVLGQHTISSKSRFLFSFNLFVLSEIFFFAGFIFSYFYSALVPSILLGNSWPPVGIEVLSPWSIPLLNTIILLVSGATITYSHNALLAKDRNNTLIGLFLTIALAWLFTAFQIYEYYESSFTLADSVFGATFFSTVSLHGVHVAGGTLFLMANYYRIWNYHFSPESHIGYESAIIYYHFVDVVWLFVFSFFYVWAS
jgi:cytochrome c oxidase subunit 3